MKTNRSGFTAIEVIMVLVLIGLLAFVGWRLMGADDTEDIMPTSQESAPTVNNTSDLQEAEDFLNDVDLDRELDTSELEETIQ